MLRGHPVDRALDLAAVRRHAVAGLEVSRAADLDDLAVFVLDDLVALYNIRAHQTHLAAGLEALELRGRHLGKVALFDIHLARERNLARARRFVARVVRHLKFLALVRGVVGDDQLDRLGHRHAAQRGLVELLADAVLEQLDVHERIRLCHARALDEVQNGARRIAAAAQRAQRGHARVVPALDVVLKHQLAQIALAHHRVRHVQARELALLGMVRQRTVVHDPLIQRAVVFKLDRAHRVRDALDRVLDRVREVIERVDAPLVALTVVMRAHDAVDRRVAQVHVRAGHVDLGAQGLGAVLELAVSHILKQLQVFLDRTAAVRAFFARLGQRAAVGAHLLLRQVVHIRLAVPDERDRALIAGLKVIRAVEHAAGRLLTGQPLDVLPDRIDVFGVLLDRVGVVIAEVEQAVVFFRDRPVDEDRLGRADVQIAVRLGRKAGVDLFGQPRRDVLVNDLGQKVVYVFHHSVRFPPNTELKRLGAAVEPLEHLAAAHDAHDRLQVGRILPPGDRHADDHGHIADRALVSVRIGLVRLGVRRIAVVFRDLLHLLKEAVRRVVLIKHAREVRQDRLGVLCGYALGHGVVGLEQLVEHEVHIALGVRPEREVLARLFAAAADGEVRLGICRVAGDERVERRVILRRPVRNELVDRVRIHAGDDVLGHVAQLFDVEQRARAAHLLGREREIVHRQGRVGAAPLLKVGIEQRHQVLEHRGHRVALLRVERERELGVLALGQLALAAGLGVDLHQLRGVRILGRLPAHGAEQLQVHRQRSEPFLAAHDDRRAHQVVVHHMGEVVGRDAVRLEDDHILIVLGDLHLALDQILVADLVLNAALRAEAHDIGRALLELGFDVLHRPVAPDRVLAVVAEILLVLFLLRVRRSELLLRAEAGVSHAALHERLDKGLVDLRALALAVGAVGAVVAVQRRALVKGQAERGKRLDDGLYAALYLALFVRILDAQVEHAARLVRQALVHQRAVQVAQMHEAGRAGTHAGHLCALGQAALRIARLDLLGRGIDLREQQFRQAVIVHFLSLQLPVWAFLPMIEIFYHSAKCCARRKNHKQRA